MFHFKLGAQQNLLQTGENREPATERPNGREFKEEDPASTEGLWPVQVTERPEWCRA